MDKLAFGDLGELKQNILIATKVMGRELQSYVVICVNCASHHEPYAVLPYTEWFGVDACFNALKAVEKHDAAEKENPS